MTRVVRVLDARLALFILLLFPAAARAEVTACSPTLFIEAVAYPTDSSARRVAVGDFNGDNRPDAATTGTSPSSVSVLLNDGSGGLLAPIVTPLPDEPGALAAADLRDNGTTDLLVTTYSGVYVLLGHGDGTFDDPEFYTADTFNISSVVVGAFDENSGLDIAVASFSSSNAISVLPGAGDGTFGEPILTLTTWPILSLASGDFDGEGHLDLVASSGQAGYVLLYPSFGDGTFGPPSSFIAGQALTGLVVGDFDGDTNPDVAVGTNASISVLLGNGSGNFEAALLYAARLYVGALATADLDQDGALDIVAAETSDYSTEGSEVSVLRGLGDGSFEPGSTYSSGRTQAIATADLNDDSLPDVLTSGGSVFVLLTSPDGSLLAVPNSHVAGPHARNFAKADWNNDGLLDFAWVSGSEVALIEGVEGGRFREAGFLPSPEFEPQPFGVAAGRFFDPQTWDIVISTYSDVFLYRGNGDGTFQAPVSVFTSFNLGAIDAADFDGFALDDVVVGQGCCGSGNITQLMNQGGGSFTPIETPFPEDAIDFLPAVLNNDPPAPGFGGTQDLVVISQSGVRVLFSSLDGGFNGSVSLPGYSESSVAVGYFSGGLQDLLISSGSASVSLYLNNGDRTFAPPIVIALASSGERVTSGFYNDDLETDFAVWSGGRILVFLGLGNGHFFSPIPLSSEIDVSSLVSFGFGNRDDLYAIGQSGIAAFRNARLGARVFPVSVLTGLPAVLEARATGYGTVTYEWRRDGVPLSDGGAISGAHTNQLTIDPTTFADAGAYDVIVTDECTTTTSNTADLSVEFADVPLSSPFHDDILTIATNGVTGGCGGADFCPTSVVQRDQMAAFLLRSEHGAAYEPPDCSEEFLDVPCPGQFTDWIEQLFAEGVTGGCGTDLYCPDESVTRAQMAIFLLKTKEGSGYTPPQATGIFEDVPVGSFGADFIEELYHRGITGGCSVSPLLYCPGSAVLRQQMATFLVRTFFP